MENTDIFKDTMIDKDKNENSLHDVANTSKGKKKE